MCRKVYELFILPKSPDEDMERREYVLNILIVCSLLLLISFDISVAYYSFIGGDTYPGIPFSAFSLIVVAFALLLILSRRGHVKFASHGLIWIFILAISHASFTYGANLQQALLGFALVGVISSILISTRYSFFITSIVSIITLGIWQLQLNHTIYPRWPWLFTLKFHHGIEFIVLLFLITIVSWLSNREIERSLARVRLSEIALIKERDLLEQKVEERTYELKQAQLEKLTQVHKMAKFGKLSSGIIHDLMNPLTALSLNIQSIESKATQESKLYIEQALRSTKRIEEFVAALQKQTKNHDINIFFDPLKEIHEVTSILEYKARKNNAAISIHPITTIHQLYGNPLKFHQLILNLVSNALDACESNNFSSKVEILLSEIPNTHSLKILVSDTGCGIPPQNLTSIFNPFFTTKTFDHGTGIGLSMTKEIVEHDFKGVITVTSIPSKGATFTIILPILSEHTDEHTD